MDFCMKCAVNKMSVKYQAYKKLSVSSRISLSFDVVQNSDKKIRNFLNHPRDTFFCETCGRDGLNWCEQVLILILMCDAHSEMMSEIKCYQMASYRMWCQSFWLDSTFWYFWEENRTYESCFKKEKKRSLCKKLVKLTMMMVVGGSQVAVWCKEGTVTVMSTVWWKQLAICCQIVYFDIFPDNQTRNVEKHQRMVFFFFLLLF